jgi:hypothetical protein
MREGCLQSDRLRAEISLRISTKTAITLSRINTMITLTEKLATLPPNLVQEVDDFVDFLLTKHLPNKADNAEEMQRRKNDIEQNRNILHFSTEEWETYCAEHRVSR